MLRNIAIVVAALSLGLAGAADAKSCKDAKGKFTKCPAAASAPMAMSGGGMASMAGHPQCKKGKACGNACIAMNKVCHK
jgi:hypothetical protein